jgi:hypothetical protein
VFLFFATMRESNFPRFVQTSTSLNFLGDVFQPGFPKVLMLQVENLVNP